MNKKYSNEKLPDNLDISFGEQDVNDYFVNILESLTDYSIWHIETKKMVGFNYFEVFLKEVKKNPELLEEYYKKGDIQKKEGWLSIDVFSEVIAKLTFNTELEEKKVLEYKYNPMDFIRGGILKITARRLSEDMLEDDTQTKEVAIMTDSKIYKYAASNTDLKLNYVETGKKVNTVKCSVNEKKVNAGDFLV